MTDELEQRIEKALDLLKPQDVICMCGPDLKWICKTCLIRGVLCDMQCEMDQLQKQRDVAIKHLAEWCARIHHYGNQYRVWDHLYAETLWQEGKLQHIADLLKEQFDTAMKGFE